MLRIALSLSVAVLLAGCETISREDLQELDYGPRPTGWKQAILVYLEPKMPDSNSAVITLQTQPKAYVQRETMMRDRHWGWAVCVHVDENHIQGAEEPYAVTFFFRGEKMVFVNGGPGDRNPIGSGYARLQCRELGAPPLAPGLRKPAAAAPTAVQRPTSPFPQ
jgi:hypothetical protein